MKVKLTNLDGTPARATSNCPTTCSASSRAPTSSTASSPGSSRTAAASPAPRASASDVARTGKKFGRQKGGGTARHGDRRAPIFIGGGKAHGSAAARVRRFAQQEGPRARAEDGAVGEGARRPDRDRQPRYEGRQDQGARRQLAKANWGRKVLVIDGEAVNEQLRPRRRATSSESTCSRRSAPMSMTS